MFFGLLMFAPMVIDFTKNTAFSAAIISPLVCLAPDHAMAQSKAVTTWNKYGHRGTGWDNSTVCANNDGIAVKSPTRSPDLVWQVLVYLAGFAAMAVISLLLAVLTGVLTNVFSKKKMELNPHGRKVS